MSFLRCTHAGGFVLLLLLSLCFVCFQAVFRGPGAEWLKWLGSESQGSIYPLISARAANGTIVRGSQTVLKVRLFLPVFRHLPPWMNHHNQLSFS